MKCIFCLRDGEPSDEHIIPKAVGGTLVINRVCRPCNSFLGHDVDDALVNSFPSRLARYALGIPNHDGRLPNPFGEGQLDDGRKVRVDLDPEDGMPTPKLHPLKETTEGGERWTIPASELEALPKMIARYRRRIGLPALSREAMDAQIEVLLANAERFNEQPTIRHSKRIDISGWPRALSKIAYEFAWYWLGDTCLDDPSMTAIRHYVLSTETSTMRNVSGKFEIGGGEAQPPFSCWADKPYRHIAFLTEAGGRLAVGLRILNLCNIILPLGKTDLPRGQPFTGQFLSIDPVTGETEKRSFVEEIARYSRAADESCY